MIWLNILIPTVGLVSLAFIGWMFGGEDTGWARFMKMLTETNQARCNTQIEIEKIKLKMLSPSGE